MAKKEAKPILISLILFLQEFDFDVNDRKGCEHQVADYLSELESNDVRVRELEIDDAFPN